MSPSDFARALTLAATLAVTGCGSPPPGSVDEEALAADLGACLRRDPICIGAEWSHPAEMLTTDALFMAQGGKISLPLLRPANASRLQWLVLGATAFVPVELEHLRDTMKQRVRVTITGAPPVDITTQAIFKRLEIDFGGYVPPPDARIEIEILEGYWVFQWVVGRWNR